MSDIIQDANRLLEGATPGPWKFEESTGYEYPAGPEWGSMMTELEHSVQDKDGYHLFGAYNDYRMIEAPGNLPLAAAAPELAQALAEEEYQYGVTYLGVNHGGNHTEWVEPTGDSEWDEDTLQLLVKRWKRKGQSPKIVRRRVSPPEVINE